MPEERKLVTILFADIVGSAAVGAAEDPELVRKTFARVFAQMRESLTAHGGTVEKFVGDAVMAVFGIPQAHDDDAERAVRAAFVLRDGVAALSSSLPFPVHLRIGVNTGQVVTGGEGMETLVTGGPVNVAARLQQSAAPGEIVVGALTRTLVEGGVRFGSGRAIDAKNVGVVEAFPAEALLTALPEQHRGLGQLRAPLIGRDGELRLLRESFEKAAHERTAYLVTVYGQAGVGKSRLVREFVEIVGRAHVLRGRCLPYGSGITYWPILEMLRADCEISGDDPRDEATRKLRTVVLAAFGDSSEDAEPVARRLAVMAGLATVEETLLDIAATDVGEELRWAARRYFEQRASREPLALIFDDIQWAEEPMLGMIEHLGEWSRAALFVLCLARPELRDRRPSWGGGLMNAAAVRLEPLSDDETRRLITALLTIEDLPESVRATVVARAQGNPLYVEELLRMLIDANHIEQRGGRFVAATNIADVPVPATLQALLTARLDQLPPAVKHVLQRASVVGKVFYADALVALGPPEGRLEEHLSFAARRELVLQRDERGPGGGHAYQFKHILIRDMAYESLPKEERSRLHDAMGRWLETAAGERRDEYAGIVAHHADQAFRLAQEMRGAEANALGRRALDLLLAGSRKARRGGDLRADHEFVRRASAIAEAIGASLAERAEALGFAALARDQVEGWKPAREDLAAALTLAREAGPSEVLVRLLLNRGYWLWDVDVEEGRAAYREAIDIAHRHGNPDLTAEAMIGAAWTPCFLGELDEELRILSEAREYIRASGAHGVLPFCLFRLATNAAQRGDFARLVEIERERAEAVKNHESRYVRVRAPVGSAYRLARFAGRHEEAIAAAHRLAAIDQEFGTGSEDANWGLGRSLYEAGRYPEAVAALQQSVRTQEATTSSGFSGESRQLLARAQLAAGDLASARASAELAYSEIAANDPLSRTTTSTALAMVRAAEGNIVEAERLHREAVDITDRTGYQFVAAQARQAYAEFLLTLGRAAEARPLLERVRDFFAHPFVIRRRERAEELLRRCDEVRA
jgi:class 3 adenylate cyclase/tetratricopeptide (TPR) repeat protein